MSDRHRAVQSAVARNPTLYYGNPEKTDSTHAFYKVPWRPDKHPSLAVRLSDGRWFDNPKGDGGDYTSYLERRDNLTKSEALREAEKLTMSASPPPKRNAPSPKGATTNRCPDKDNVNYAEAANVVNVFTQSIAEKTNLSGPWVYLDKEGNPDVQVRRYMKNGLKKYAQAHWKNGTLIDEKKPGPQPLYNLPDLIHSTRDIIVTEGEKACEAAMRWFPDYDCTTWPGGSSVPLTANWNDIAGRTVYLWADADDVGVKCMKKLKKHLEGIGCTVYPVDVSNLPQDGHDLADPQPAGFSYRAMLGSAYTAPAVIEVDAVPMDKLSQFWNPITSDKLMEMEFPPIEWVLPGMIPEGVTVIAAPPKIGKTFFCEELAMCLSSGKPFLGRVGKKVRVAYFDAEQTPRLIQRRFKTLGWDQGNKDVTINSMIGQKIDADALRLLTPVIKGHFDLIIIDTIGRILPKKANGDAYEVAQAHLGPFHTWCHEIGISAICIHHTRKSGGQAGGESHDAVSGGYGYAAVADSIFTMKRETNDSFNVSVTGRIERNTEFMIEQQGASWKVLGDAEVAEKEHNRMTPQQQAVWALVEKTPWLGPTLIANMTGVSRGTVAPMLLSWVDAGKMQTKPDGRRTLYALKHEVNHVQKQLQEAF